MTKSVRDLTVAEAADLVANELDADVIHYNGAIERPADKQLIDECIARNKRDNVFVILVTQGGDADPAYRIAKCLQNKYEKFYLYVSGYCKSAGTLIALGAHELVVSDHGELGPLDVQLSKKDALWETQSGLTVMDTLSALQDNAFNAFEKFFLDLQRRSDGTITLRTAAQIATDLTTGMFSQLYGQVDPLHIGEAGRAMSIAGHYGRRLLNDGENIDPNALEFIMSAYPSHGFVIDRHEAEILFTNVREPTPNERLLGEKLGDEARWPTLSRSGASAQFKFLSAQLPLVQDEESNETAKEADHEPVAESDGTGPSDVAEASRGQPPGGNGQRIVISELEHETPDTS